MPKDTLRTSQSPRAIREGNKDPNNVHDSKVNLGQTDPKKTDWEDPSYNKRDASGWPEPA